MRNERFGLAFQMLAVECLSVSPKPLNSIFRGRSRRKLNILGAYSYKFISTYICMLLGRHLWLKRPGVRSSEW